MGYTFISAIKAFYEAPFNGRGRGLGERVSLSHVLPIVRERLFRINDVGFFNAQRIYVPNNGADVLNVLWVFNYRYEVFASVILDAIGTYACGPFSSGLSVVIFSCLLYFAHFENAFSPKCTQTICDRN